VLGFYDGFFGPGTGSFFVFLFVRVLGYDFLHASAAAKLMNTATNLAALILFAIKGHVWWHYAAGAGGGQRGWQPAGHAPGAEAWRRLRARVFIFVVSALILKPATTPSCAWPRKIELQAMSALVESDMALAPRC
jgi:uncharacterized membrane protein YfcA